MLLFPSSSTFFTLGDGVSDLTSGVIFLLLSLLLIIEALGEEGLLWEYFNFFWKADGREGGKDEEWKEGEEEDRRCGGEKDELEEEEEGEVIEGEEKERES